MFLESSALLYCTSSIFEPIEKKRGRQDGPLVWEREQLLFHRTQGKVKRRPCPHSSSHALPIRSVVRTYFGTIHMQTRPPTHGHVFPLVTSCSHNRCQKAVSLAMPKKRKKRKNPPSEAESVVLAEAFVFSQKIVSRLFPLSTATRSA